MTRPLRIVITTGDVDGIGFEITAKALAKLRPKRDVQFILWRSPNSQARYLKLIDQAFTRRRVFSWADALSANAGSYKELIDIESHQPPAAWVEASARASLYGHIDALVTAPLSKTSITDAGLKDIGHTQILQRVTRAKAVHMAFVGERFSVVLATGHIPLSAVPTELNKALLRSAVEAADHLRSLLKARLATKPIALLGLNPHAGEAGLIGDEEVRIHAELVKELKQKDIPIEGPLVPDAAFQERNWKQYSVYVANYHDQGLIPFKMIHGQKSGVHLTLGLPFIRTSVDHGTAKDIFGKNKADPSSMLDALNWAISLSKSSASMLFRGSKKTSKTQRG